MAGWDGVVGGWGGGAVGAVGPVGRWDKGLGTVEWLFGRDGRCGLALAVQQCSPGATVWKLPPPVGCPPSSRTFGRRANDSSLSHTGAQR